MIRTGFGHGSNGTASGSMLGAVWDFMPVDLFDVNAVKCLSIGM